MFEFIYINISCPPIMLLHSLDYFFFLKSISGDHQQPTDIQEIYIYTERIICTQKPDKRVCEHPPPVVSLLTQIYMLAFTLKGQGATVCHPAQDQLRREGSQKEYYLHFCLWMRALTSRTRPQINMGQFHLLPHPVSPQVCTAWVYLAVLISSVFIASCYNHKASANTVNNICMFCTLTFPGCYCQHSQRLPSDTPSVSICISSACFLRLKSLGITRVSNLNIFTKNKT